MQIRRDGRLSWPQKLKAGLFLSSRPAEAKRTHNTSGSPGTIDATLGLGHSLLLPTDDKTVASPLVYLFALATKMLIIQIFLLNCYNFYCKSSCNVSTPVVFYILFYSFVLVMSSKTLLFFWTLIINLLGFRYSTAWFHLYEAFKIVKLIEAKNGMVMLGVEKQSC